MILTNVCSSAKDQPFDKSLYKAIKSGNYDETTGLLETFFSKQELSIGSNLKWVKVSPFALYNYYNERYHLPAIVVGDFPAKTETWTYWETWSEHLTKSKWDPKNFFKNEKQALELAQYNVLMLLSHELGHHIAHRHGVRNNNLNCHEYTADMASMALIASFPQKSKLARLQTSYLRLLRDINKSIEDSSRFDPLNKDLHNHCDCIDVEFPGDSSQMAQYASAYFARRQMLDANNRFKSTEEIVDSIYKFKQIAWEQQFPRIKATSNIFLESENPFKMEEKGVDQYAYHKIMSWGNDWIYEVNSMGYEDSGSLYSIQFNWPEKLIKGALNTISIFDQSGTKYYDWHYYPDTTTEISNFKYLGFAAKDVRENFTFLTYETDTNDIGTYCLYSPGRGYQLKKETLNISIAFHTKGDCQLKEVTPDYIVFYANGDNQITKIVYNRALKSYRATVLFSLGVVEVYENGWQGSLVCDANDAYFVFILNDYVMMWYKEKLYTLLGSGIKGTKSNNRGDVTTEFDFVKAIHIENKKLMFYEEVVNTQTDSNVFNLWEIDFVLPD